LSAYQDELNLTSENLQTKQSTLLCIQNELKQKQQQIDELKKLKHDEINIYGTWMRDCVRTIENDRRFHKKPVGPIGLYIRCNQPKWSYAVEKHLAPCMETFICSDRHDELILLDIFSKYPSNSRPRITVTKFSDKAPDVSGTLAQVRKAGLVPIYDILTITNPIAETYLIDNRQIEATILLQDLNQAKQIRQGNTLRWKIVDRKVKQVVEAWTIDGSNIKLDRAFRIYTNDRQPAKYFTTTNAQALSINELERDVKQLNTEIHQKTLSMNELRKIQQRITENLQQGKQSKIDIQQKINELTQQIDRYNSRMPEACAYSVDELKDKLQQCQTAKTNATDEFDRVKNEKENKHQLLAGIVEQLENVEKKINEKTRQREIVTEKIHELTLDKQEIQQQAPRLTKKYDQLNEDIQRCQQRYEKLTKNQSKVSFSFKSKSVFII